MLEKLNKEIKAIALHQTRVILFILTGIILNACSGKMPTFTEAEREVQILPDYSGITLPPNIAPLNFTISEKAEKYLVKLYEAGGEAISITSSTGNIRIPEGKWKKLLQRCRGKDMFVEVFIKKDGGWIKFPAIINHVAVEPIDSYVVYRLIDP